MQLINQTVYQRKSQRLFPVMPELRGKSDAVIPDLQLYIARKQLTQGELNMPLSFPGESMFDGIGDGFIQDHPKG